jgi:hypothetical protein
VVCLGLARSKNNGANGIQTSTTDSSKNNLTEKKAFLDLKQKKPGISWECQMNTNISYNCLQGLPARTQKTVKKLQDPVIQCFMAYESGLHADYFQLTILAWLIGNDG